MIRLASLFLLLFLSFGLLAFAQTPPPLTNPPAEGFNEADSDPYAIVLADEVMKACGGRQAWDHTRYLHWTFFGARTLTWDKWEQRVRVAFLQKDLRAILDMKDMSGQVWKDGEALSNPDSLQKYLQLARNIWINDSYWLVMPFKLKDSGVTLKHLGAESLEDGSKADILQLTFENVGLTPENKYHVYIDQESKRVSQWAFFRSAGQDQPDFVMPWKGYQRYGDIWLSGDRGARKLTHIRVFEELPERIFTSLFNVNWDNFR
jgi:hypothetical protein